MHPYLPTLCLAEPLRICLLLYPNPLIALIALRKMHTLRKKRKGTRNPKFRTTKLTGRAMRKVKKRMRKKRRKRREKRRRTELKAAVSMSEKT
jgi:hypothetical protein